MIPYFFKKILAGDLNSLNLLVFLSVFLSKCIDSGYPCEGNSCSTLFERIPHLMKITLRGT